MYDRSREEAVFIIVGRGGDLFSNSLVNPFKEDSAQGGTLIFSYLHRLGSFIWVEIF